MRSLSRHQEPGRDPPVYEGDTRHPRQSRCRRAVRRRELVMSAPQPFYVLLDANVWVAERLLQSSIGSALLYALTGANALLLLPEVVELEVNRVLPELAEKAVTVIRRETSLLRQLSGHTLMFTGPSVGAIADGIKDRWEKLDGLLERIPFTNDQARAALHRVIRKAPPSGENNEQFRDSCIWEAALSAASNRPVHLVTADSAFYESRNRSAGLAAILKQELAQAEKDIRLYSDLKDFLAAVPANTPSIDEEAIGRAILEAVTPRAHEIASDKGNFTLAMDERAFEVGGSLRPRIRGYATPKPSLIAISFEVAFDLKSVERSANAGGKTEAGPAAELTLRGVCSFDPNAKAISEVELREWSTALFSERAPGTSPVHTQLQK